MPAGCGDLAALVRALDAHTAAIAALHERVLLIEGRRARSLRAEAKLRRLALAQAAVAVPQPGEPPQ